MMPEGVEHMPNENKKSWAKSVTDSMMPEGVEHSAASIIEMAVWSDRFHDAGRR